MFRQGFLDVRRHFTFFNVHNKFAQPQSCSFIVGEKRTLACNLIYVMCLCVTISHFFSSFSLDDGPVSGSLTRSASSPKHKTSSPRRKKPFQNTQNPSQKTCWRPFKNLITRWEDRHESSARCMARHPVSVVYKISRYKVSVVPVERTVLDSLERRSKHPCIRR